MEKEYEIVPHERVQNINIFINKITYRSFHMHNDIELIYVIDGSGVINTRDKSHYVKSGSLIILNSYQEHEINAHEEALTAIFIQISPHLLKRFLNHFTNIRFKCNDITALISDEKALEFQCHIISAALAYFENKEFFIFGFISDISKILSLLFTEIPFVLLSEKDYVNWKRQTKRMNIIFSYIEDNYLIPIHLEDVCSLIGITPTHLSHLFTKNIGISFQDFVNTLRFEHAMRLLTDKSISLTKVAESSGFSKLKYMNQTFEKKLGMKPNEYRAKITCNTNVQNSKDLLEHIFNNEESLEILHSLTDQNITKGFSAP